MANGTHPCRADQTNKIDPFRGRGACLPVALLILVSSFFPPSGMANDAVPDRGFRASIQPIQLVNSLKKRVGKSSQLLLVRNIDPASVEVRITPWERKNGRWQSPFTPMDGVIGRKGIAPPGEKREGDGRTPVGIFRLGMVFGYAPAFPTRMPYRQATADDVWIDDVQAADYNRWVRRETTQAASFEKMRRDDDLYKHGIVVEYNTNPVLKGMGSAIFVHLWRGQGSSTAGCIALAEEDLVRIIKWLDPAAKPLVIIGLQETSGGFEK